MRDEHMPNGAKVEISSDAAFPYIPHTYFIECRGEALFNIAQSCKVVLDSLKMGKEGPDLAGGLTGK